MQAQDAKYKKWGWGALIGLAAVIVIAGLAVAISMSAPKKATEADKANGPSSTIAENGGNSNNKDDNNDDDKDSGREDNEKSDAGADGTDGTDGTGNSNNSNNAGNSNNSSNTNTASNMPKTGPEEDTAAIMAWAAIAGLGAYYFLNAKKSA